VGAGDPDPEADHRVANRDVSGLDPGAARPSRKVRPERNGRDPDRGHRREKRVKRRRNKEEQ